MLTFAYDTIRTMVATIVINRTIATIICKTNYTSRSKLKTNLNNQMQVIYYSYNSM